VRSCCSIGKRGRGNLHVITLIPGDGIGPEVTAAVVKILECAGLAVQWEPHETGAAALDRFGDPLPATLLESIRRNRVALKGPVTTPVGGGFTSVNVGLRKALDLFANLRPVKSLPSVRTRYEKVDLVVIRENTEDLYAGLEHEVVPGVVESLKITTEASSARIARFAFDYAKQHRRIRVTAVHKANIMKMGDGLFLNTFRQTATDYPDIASDDRIVDATCLQLVMNPEKFDVLVLPNLYGDIVSDLCAGLVGGLGVVPGANLGADIGVFEAVHGSAPDIADKNLANPTALLLSAIMMLDHLGEQPRAERLRAALARVLVEGRIRTRDLGGTASTTEFTDAICREVEK
jgi:isocitrate dehydrogenase (NAD+)